MNTNQKRAIQVNLEDIVRTLEGFVEPFLNRLRIDNIFSHEFKQIIDGHQTDRAKLVILLQNLETKDNGWEALVQYLSDNKYETLVAKLNYAMGQEATFSVPTTVSCMSDFMIEFKLKLIEHYKAEYSRVPTVLDRHKSIEDIWVPLRIENTTETFLKGNKYHDHVELLMNMKQPQSPHIALVKGHPGVGKTTLVKKIAYDWAMAIKTVDQFSLILAVPLRYAGEAADFVELAADYYTNKLRLSNGQMSELVNSLKQLGRELLICLDGLDEYSSLVASPFKYLFAAPFQSPKTSIRSQPPSLRYQLLITSRPYACDQVNRDFHPLRLEICTMNEAHVTEFVRRYCETEEGRNKVEAYLKDNVKLVIKVPLILMFVCYLADLEEEIPINLTLLYERFLERMLRRQIQKDGSDGVNSFNTWKDSVVFKSTAHLAFDRYKNGKFEFPLSLKNDFCGTEDSFKCGFLRHKYDFKGDRLIVEFLHRSIQEFFAALHCYHLIFTDNKTERDSIMKEIIQPDSYFGRFFFGICSTEIEVFKTMLEWLNPTFADVRMCSYNFNHFLNVLSASLTDCSEAKLFGQNMAGSLDQLENHMTSQRDDIIGTTLIGISDLNERFQAINYRHLELVKKNQTHL